MSAITWNAAGQRRFAAGVSQGVLYPPGGPGVPWNGLVSVQEKPQGGASSSYHFDGIKYADLYGGESFQAVLQAYTYPLEFEELDGSVQLAPGLFATGQPRQSQFGLCYKTGLGNDIQGLEFGYELHLVYNASVEPSERSHSTRDASVKPENFSWTINAIAPDSVLYKPTAHFVVDSTQTDPRVMAVLEGHLYGVATNVPYLPPQDFIIEMMNSVVTSIDGGDAEASGPIILDGGSAASPSTDSYDGGESDTLTIEDYTYS